MKWDKRFLRLAREVGSWSKDGSTKCGAVVTKNNRLISVGFNGFPRGCDDDPEMYADRKRKYLRGQHAERNAIAFAKQDLHGCTFYVQPLFPCAQCMGAMIQEGITRVVSFVPNAKQMPRWGDDYKESVGMAAEVGMEVVYYDIIDLFGLKE